MKKIVSLILSVATLIGCAAVLVGCGKEDAGAQFAVYLGEEVYDFDPSDYYADDNAEQVMSLLFEPLFVLDEDGDLKKGMAKDYDVDKKSRTITVKLAESYWSNGIRVAASDFVYAWRDRILNPENSNPAAALFYDIEGAYEVSTGKMDKYSVQFGVSATDTYELEIKYREGADYKQLLRNLASVAASPVCQAAVDKDSTVDTWSKYINTMVFNGPFSIRNLNYDNNMFNLTRNNGYHRDPTELEYDDVDDVVRPYILFSTFNENEVLKLSYQDIEKKTVFYMGDASLADRKANADNAVVADTLSTYSYAFNTTNEFLALKEVRQALSMAIDRDAIIKAVTFGKAATGFLPETVKNVDTGKSFRKNNSIIATGANPTGAEAKLAAVASTISSMDKTINLFVNDDEQSRTIAALVEAAWEALGYGITVNVKPVNSKDAILIDDEGEPYVDYRDSAIQYIVKQASVGIYEYEGEKVDVIAVDWQMYSDDALVALSAFSSEYGGCGYGYALNESQLPERNYRVNITGWKSSAYDQLIKEAYQAKDEETEAAKLVEAEKLLVDNCPIAPIMFNQNFAFISKDLGKIDMDGFGHFIFTKAKLKNYEEYLPKED